MLDRETTESALVELDSLLAQDVADEHEYQAWFERHPIVLLALGYRRPVPHPTIIAENGSKFVPDFLVELPNGAWEIFELKTPQTAITHDRDRRDTFYATFSAYVSQCHDYSEALDPISVRDDLAARAGIRIQKRPQSIIVAGRSSGLDRAKVHQLCARLTPPIQHYTFDDIRAQLEYHRVFQFGTYDEAVGFAAHFIVAIERPPNRVQNNHIFDMGTSRDRDRISIFVNPDGHLRLVIYDSNGQRHDARSEDPLPESAFGVPHLLYVDAGVSGKTGFLTIELDSQYYADIRIQDFPLKLSPNAFAIGTDWNGGGSSWLAYYQLAVFDRPLSFDRKLALRELSQLRIAEIQSNIGAQAVTMTGQANMATDQHLSRNRPGAGL